LSGVRRLPGVLRLARVLPRLSAVLARLTAVLAWLSAVLTTRTGLPVPLRAVRPRLAAVLRTPLGLRLASVLTVWPVALLGLGLAATQYEEEHRSGRQQQQYDDEDDRPQREAVACLGGE
jgi:hypothetical protein